MLNYKNKSTNANQLTAITNARIFDGENVIDSKTVVISGNIIISVGGEIPSDATIIDAKGCTLLPGLIDSHVHTSEEGLRDALKFGVTTELEMMGEYTKKGREELKDIQDIADVRSAGMAVTAPGGHPLELFPHNFKPEWIARFEADAKERGEEEPYVTNIEKAVKHVDYQVSQGADYIKIMIDDGTIENKKGLPVLSDEILKAAVDEAHKLGKLVMVHQLTADATKTAINLGVDGLAHLFVDRPSWTPELIKSIAERRIFVIPCLSLNSSLIGNPGSNLAQDSRVYSKLSSKWLNTLNACFNCYTQGKMKDSFENVMALRNAGVDILVGTDVSVPVPSLGGLAHGASVHHELQLLVEAGFTPIEALRAATSVPARIFNLTDRGHITSGARADLLLVDGDPITNISDTLSIRAIWTNGNRLRTI